MSHWYSKTGDPLPEGMGYPSVTTILAIRHNEGLQAWRDRVGAEAADLRGKEATDKGTAVHNILEAIVKGKPIPQVSKELLPFIRGFNNWFETVQPQDMRSEVFLFSELHEYGGTADLICTINGEQWVIDFKTSKSIHADYALQLAAYEQAWYEMGNGRSRRAVLQLTDQIKRGYRFKEFTDDDDFGDFMAHKAVLDWARKAEKKTYTRAV